MKSPIEDTRWGAEYGSVAAVQAAFDRFGPEYHEAILASGVPAGAAKALMPVLDREAQGVDLGCGSGVMGMALKDAGLLKPLDGVDLSPGMLELAQGTGCYRHLHQGNLLLPKEAPVLAKPYDFAVTVGLIGDYVPYYVVLPYLLTLVRPGGWLGFAVERVGTPSYGLEKLMAELRLNPISETVLPVPQAKLEGQFYHFYVAPVPSSIHGLEAHQS